MNVLNTSNKKMDLILVNAKIYTVALTIDEVKSGKTDFPIIENGMVIINDGKIVDVRDSGDLNLYTAKKIIDLKGKTLMPGFIDSHIHAMFTGIGLINLDFKESKSLDNMLESIANKANNTEARHWIQGQGWNNLSWNTKEFPTRYDLDKVSPNNPVFCMRICYHVAVANSKALELAGITKDTPNPSGGEIGRDNDGNPNGLLFENSAISLMQSVIPPAAENELVQAIEAVGKKLNENGIVNVIDANLSNEQMRAYLQAYKENKLTYRANLMFFIDASTNSLESELKRMEEAPFSTGFGNDMLKMNAVKILLDGIPAIGTAYMRRPYKHMPSTCGTTTIPKEELLPIVLKARENNWQVGIHTVGNKAADMALEVFEEANKLKEIFNDRYYIIHHPWPCKDQFEIMRKLNVGVPVQPTIYHVMEESEILYDDMANQNIPCKTYFEEGIIIGGSSDNPVGIMNPFLGMYVTVTRRDSKGVVWGKEEQITPAQALIMWTKNSSFFSHADDLTGSVEVGKFADLVVVDRDFIKGDVEDIKNTKVEITILNGKIVYENKKGHYNGK